MKEICVIIPTIRDYGIVREYVNNAILSGFDAYRLAFLLITEDFCDSLKMKNMLSELGVSGDVVNQKDRDEWFEANGVAEFKSLMPKRSHAETSFGLLWMLANGFESGIFIDDDTLPATGADYFGTHMKNLSFKGRMPCVSSDKNWVNVLYQNFARHRLYPRGYPYSCMGESVKISEKTVRNVPISQGLWTNVPDLDAVRILMGGDLNGQSSTKTGKDDFLGAFASQKGNYLTICSINLAIKKEVIPAFYQLPMDDNPWKIGRFDDIWSGVFVKKACDLMNHDVVPGMPLCIHNKAPRNTFKDLNAEAPALDINENLWKIVENIEYDSKDYYGIYREMAEGILKSKCSCINADFLPYMASKMLEWLRCVDKLS